MSAGDLVFVSWHGDICRQYRGEEWGACVCACSVASLLGLGSARTWRTEGAGALLL